MTVQTKTIGRMPTHHGDYDPLVAYGKKYRVSLFGCEWESKHDNNNTAPAVWDGGDTITPNTTDWKQISGSLDTWLETHDKPASTGSTGDYPYNGLGRIVLKKKYSENPDYANQPILEQSDFDDENNNHLTNTVFVIKYDFVLTEDITLGSGCVLEFEGGSISGTQTLTGNNTGIIASLAKIFDTTTTLAGTWAVTDVYPEWFGAIGDGLTIDDNAMLSAISLVNISITDTVQLSFAHSAYKFTRGFQIKRNIVIDGKGATLDFGIDNAEAIYYGITISKDNPITLVDAGSVSASKNTKVINTTKATALAAGDYIIIEDTTDYSYSTERAYYHAGDILKIDSVNGTAITVTDNLTQDYSGSSIVLRKLNTIKCSVSDLNFKLHNDGNVGSITSNGLLIECAVDSSINNVRGCESWHTCFTVSHSYNVACTKLYIDSNTYNHDLNYGLVISSSKKIIIKDSFLKTTRHGLAHGGGTICIPNRVISVIGNVFDDFGYGQSLDFHGNAEDVLVEGNIINNGFTCGAGKAKIFGNKIQGGLYISNYVYGDIIINGNDFNHNNVSYSGDLFCIKLGVSSNPDTTYIPKFIVKNNTFKALGNTVNNKSACILVNNTGDNIISENDFTLDNWACVRAINGTIINSLQIYDNKKFTDYIDVATINNVIYRYNECKAGHYIQGAFENIVIEGDIISDIDNAPFTIINSGENCNALIIANKCINCNSTPMSSASYDTVLRIQGVQNTYFTDNLYYDNRTDKHNVSLMYVEGNGYVQYKDNLFECVRGIIEGSTPASYEIEFPSKKGPTRPSKAIIGQQFFDTSINKPIWWTGSDWVDATGATV